MKRPFALLPHRVWPGTRTHLLAVALCIGFAVLGARSAQVSLNASGAVAATAPERPAVRADLVDRNGVLLATLAPMFTLFAKSEAVWDLEETAAGVSRVLGLEQAGLAARLRSAKGDVVLARRLTPAQRDAVFALGLPGLDFREEPRRFYPQRSLGAHAIGAADAALIGRSGLERALEPKLRRNAGPVRTSLDVRLQHALQLEVADGVAQHGARHGAGVLLDGRTGEVLALATAPSFDANNPPAPESEARLERTFGAVYEMGSTVKPFTVAMALDAGQTTPDERFTIAPLQVAGREIRDFEPSSEPADLGAILTRSSNIGSATLALRLGAQRQRAYFAALGLTAAPTALLVEAEGPIFPDTGDAYTLAARGFGHGMAVSLLALARAYSVFVNEGQIVDLRFEPLPEGDAPPLTRVFTASTTARVLSYLRANVTQGTGKRAAVAGLAMAGKTGTAEKYQAGGYAEHRNFASFAAVFPADAPRYVLLVALDEPAPGAGGGTGGAVAAPIVARIAARIGPLLALAPADETALAALEEESP